MTDTRLSCMSSGTGEALRFYGYRYFLMEVTVRVSVTSLGDVRHANATRGDKDAASRSSALPVPVSKERAAAPELRPHTCWSPAAPEHADCCRWTDLELQSDTRVLGVLLLPETLRY